MNRRGFLGLLAGSIAAAGAGVTVLAPAITKQPKRVLHARHIRYFDMRFNQFFHRIDVRIADQQYGVDFICQNEWPTEDRELAPALTVLGNHICQEFGEDIEIGEIHRFTQEEYAADKTFHDRWIALGAA